MHGPGPDLRRVLLLIPSTSYRARDFLCAAARLQVAVTVGTDHAPALAAAGDGHLRLQFHPVGDGVARIVEFARRHPLHAVVGTDDATGVLAAAAARALGLGHNPPDAVRSVQDKHRFREALERAGLPSPWFRLVDLHGDLDAAARGAHYPCVLKPLHLCASQGVIRADGPREFVNAARRIRRIAAGAAPRVGPRGERYLLAEGFLPGREVALEGILSDGVLTVLAVFDKPLPMDGPFFEESLYVSPSTLPVAALRELACQVETAARAVGLRRGPVHAEGRVDGHAVCLLEMAPRSIGGLCSRAVPIAPGVSLEEVILRQALDLPPADSENGPPASGVMMIPIPREGRLAGVDGVADARVVPYVEDVVISMARGDALVPLPEGNRYLGFIFARGPHRDAVEAALRSAHACLEIHVAG